MEEITEIMYKMYEPAAMAAYKTLVGENNIGPTNWYPYWNELPDTAKIGWVRTVMAAMEALHTQ